MLLLLSVHSIMGGDLASIRFILLNFHLQRNIYHCHSLSNIYYFTCMAGAHQCLSNSMHTSKAP